MKHNKPAEQWSAKYMQEIVKAEKGKLLPINNEEKAQLMLIRLIKENSIITTE